LENHPVYIFCSLPTFFQKYKMNSYLKKNTLGHRCFIIKKELKPVSKGLFISKKIGVGIA